MPQYVKVSLPNDLSLVLGTNTNTISKYDFFFFFLGLGEFTVKFES